MKIEMKTNKLALRFFQKLTFLSTIEFVKEYSKIIKRFGRNFHNGLYASLTGFAVN